MDIAAGIMAVVIAYLLGSIPGAYIVTRFAYRQDIRKLGGGNVGAHNVYLHLGFKAAIPVAIIDVGKGAMAILMALRLTGMPSMQSFSILMVCVLAAGLAAVAGHIWPVYLRFTGGNGIATTIGVLAILMPRELLIVLGLSLVLMVITRNPVLSVNLSLLLLVVFAWFSGDPRQYFFFLISLGLLLVIHFIPDARDALGKAGGMKKLAAELVRTDEASNRAVKTKRQKVRKA